MAANKDPQAKVAFLYTNLYQLHRKAQNTSPEASRETFRETFSEAQKSEWRAQARPHQAPTLSEKKMRDSSLDRALHELEQVESKMRFLLEELERTLGKTRKA